MSGKQMFKGIKSKLCSIGISMLLLGTVGLSSVAPARANTTTTMNASGSYSGRYRLGANRTQSFTWNLTQGQQVDISVFGDGTTDLDLYIRDPWGRVVAEDDDFTDYCLASFKTRYSGTYTIEVVNRGSIYNDYDITFDSE